MRRQFFLEERKGNPHLVKQGRNNWFMYHNLAGKAKYHPTQKPILLMQDIYSIFLKPGSSILIPFLGSGAGVLAANNLGMNAFGYDLSKQYKDEFTRRVLEGTLGQYRDYKKVED